MDASTFTTPAFMTSLAPPALSTSSAATPEPATIKMEDLQKPQLPMTPPAESQKQNTSQSHAASPSSSPQPSSSSNSNSESKPVKKRKSWGQVLPEPKTNLPPRKRAKTEDEKEQRRIERVKRNRLAAHNSRERKRQEVEALQQDKKNLEDRVHQLEAAIRVYQQHLPDLKIEAFNFQASTPLSTAQPATPAPSNETSDTINPRTASFTSLTPQTSPSLGSIDSPPYSDSQPATPEAYPEATVADHDETQHSAAMLCDLQCPSCISNPALDASALDDLFNFSSFDDISGHLHNDQDKYPNTFFETQFPDDLVNLDLPNHLGGDLDLLAASGATSIVSDETGIADSI